jgi:hypothetical protein
VVRLLEQEAIAWFRRALAAQPDNRLYRQTLEFLEEDLR